MQGSNTLMELRIDKIHTLVGYIEEWHKQIADAVCILSDEVEEQSTKIERELSCKIEDLTRKTVSIRRMVKTLVSLYNKMYKMVIPDIILGRIA